MTIWLFCWQMEYVECGMKLRQGVVILCVYMVKPSFLNEIGGRDRRVYWLMVGF